MFHSLQFYDTLSRFGLDRTMRQNGTVIAAYSGGADSSCLLHHLYHWCAEHGVFLAAAHVNHGIREEDADRDEAFCRQTCENLGIPLYVRRVNVPELARENSRGLEETARIVRYAFFDEVSEQLTGSPTAALVATAHNADDHLETVLFHLLRGSGTRGLCGIDPLRDGRFLRPLIADTGADIRRWCAEHGIAYVTDVTNADTEYTRNLIRHTVVPPMLGVSDHPQKAVLRMSALLRQDNDFLDSTAGQYLPAGAVSVERDTLNALHPAIASRVLIRMYQNTGSGSTPEERHIREMLRLSASGGTDFTLSLPGNIRFSANRHTVRFTEEPFRIRKKTPESPETSDEIVFTYPTDGNRFENERFVIRFSPNGHANNFQEDENIYKLFICRTFCFDKIRNVLHIRYRRPGDTYFFGGMTRKVKKLFIDRKFTGDEKASLPLICEDTGEILWIPRFPPRDHTQAENGTPGLTIAVYEKKTL